MNKSITKPLIIQFTPPEAQPSPKRASKSYFIPVNLQWAVFSTQILPLVGTEDYDSVLIHTRDDVNRDMKGVVGNMMIKTNALSSAATKAGKPVLAYESSQKPFYFMNPSNDDMKQAGTYAPSDETIMAKYNSYENDDAWQAHQGVIWNRMKDMMPLSRKATQYDIDHAAQLKDPKRGLSDKELDKFWSFKARKGLAPTIMGDDMIGMPSVEGREYDGFTMANTNPDGTVTVKPLQVRSLMTAGANGIAIPMANANGDVNKHQIATDLTPYGTALHFRAEDGVTVTKGELFSKKTREYAFKFADGTDTHLKVSAVAQDNTITLQDTHGIFNVKFKTDIIDTLKDRGYDIPPIITSIKTEQNGKYMWQSPGSMTGSDDVLKTVSPSNPGFIKARDPKNGSNDYVVLVAEGALKGHIVAKYVDVKDKTGMCFGDRIGGNSGIIVTQVPGVAEAYVKNAVSIYDKYNVKGTYIAMDADGRENRNVCLGIHSAYDYISKFSPTAVLSWDPAQKGMDDALLAVAQGKITIADMDLKSGTAEALFPLEKSHVMTPYKLDGTRTKTPSWQQEYEEDKAARMEKVAAAQAETAAREAHKNPFTEEEIRAAEISNFQAGEEIRVYGRIMSPEHFIDRQAYENYQRKMDLKEENEIRALEGKPPLTEMPEKIADKTGEKQSGKSIWVETPSDISGIQNTTVTKAAEMAEAMKGNVPIPKAETVTKRVPDPDEAPDIEDKEDVLVKNPAEAWSEANPAMPSVEVPDIYKSTFLYQQPVLSRRVPDFGMENAKYDEREPGKWGIMNITTENELSTKEKKAFRKMLSDRGAQCVGPMRLTSQTVSLDNSMTMELSDDDMMGLDTNAGRNL